MYILYIYTYIPVDYQCNHMHHSLIWYNSMQKKQHAEWYDTCHDTLNILWNIITCTVTWYNVVHYDVTWFNVLHYSNYSIP